MSRKPVSSARLLRDVRGAVAVEFAILAPVLMLFYFGMSEMTQAMMAQRRLSHTASLIGDIAAQNVTISTSRANDIYEIGRTVMQPFSSSPLRLCLVSIVSDSTGKDTVAWSYSKNSPANCPAQGAVVTTVSSSVLPASTSVIMSRVSYQYEPAIKLMSTKFDFSRTFFLRPRKSDTVTWSTS